MYSTSKNELEDEDVKKARNDERECLIERGEGDDDDDDGDFFLKGPSSKKSVTFAADKVKSVQAQISGVTDVMRDNVSRLMERGDQLDELNARSDHLANTSDTFRNNSLRLRRKAWWQNTKGKIVIIGLLAIILLVVFVPIILKQKKA